MNQLRSLHTCMLARFSICLFLLSSLFTGCKSTTTASEGDSDLAQYRWYVTEILGEEVSGLDGKRPYVEFSGDTQRSVSGFAGCNRFSGSLINTSQDELRFSPLAATKMSCENNAIETRLFDALAKVRRGNRDGKAYTLYAGDTALLQLHGIAHSDIALAGRWELVSIAGDGPAFSDQYSDRIPYIVFDLTTEHIGGHTSCNGFSAQYTIKENQISFRNALKTMMACEGGGEERFLDMLNRTTTFELADDTLIFGNTDGETMRLKKT